MKNYFTPEDDKLKWTEGEPKTLLKTVVCKITERHNISSDGLEGDYIIMDAPDWVIVIAEHEDKFLMVMRKKQPCENWKKKPAIRLEN